MRKNETERQKAYRLSQMKKAWPKRSDYHGMCGTKFYNCWRSMITRCKGTAGEDSKIKYRDKGIRVCEKWKHFRGFHEDMFPSYSEGKTIDRIDNSKGYFKENCRWASAKEQANNRNNTIRITYNGISLTLGEWSKKIGIKYGSLRYRYYYLFKKGKIDLDKLLTEGKISRTYNIYYK